MSILIFTDNILSSRNDFGYSLLPIGSKEMTRFLSETSFHISLLTNFSKIYFENKSSVVYSLALRFLKFLINYTRKPLSPLAIRSVKGRGFLSEQVRTGPEKEECACTGSHGTPLLPVKIVTETTENNTSRKPRMRAIINNHFN